MLSNFKNKKLINLNIVSINLDVRDKYFSGDELNEPVCIQLDDDFEEFGVRGEIINIDNQYIYQIAQNQN